MINHLPNLIARYWIAVAVLTFALLSAYTNSPIYGQSAPPTPDVNTVPRPEELATPTNTPFPTPTPNSEEDLPGGDDDNRPDPTATRPPSDDQDASDDNSDSNSTDNNPTDTIPITETGNGVDENGGLTGVVNAVTLNVRRGPSTNDRIIDTIFRNEPVTIISRDSRSLWYFICCGSGSGSEGWVSAQYVTPNFARDQIEALVPISANSSAPSQEDLDEEADEPLILEMRPSPAFVWPGKQVRLHLVLRNVSDQDYTNVRLRNDLPPTLLYVDSVVNDEGNLITTGQVEDGLIYAINWPDIPAGAQVSAVVTLQIADALSNGMLIDNLAVVDTAEGAGALAGITFAMPPIRLPHFR